jgi:hypothetical protein
MEGPHAESSGAGHPCRLNESAGAQRQDLASHQTRQSHPRAQTEDGDEQDRPRPKESRQQNQQEQEGKCEKSVNQPHQNDVCKPTARGGGETNHESYEERDRDAEGGNRDRNPSTGQQLAKDVAAEPIAAQPQPRLMLGYDVPCSNRCMATRASDSIDGAVCYHLRRYQGSAVSVLEYRDPRERRKQGSVERVAIAGAGQHERTEDTGENQRRESTRTPH